MYHHVVGYMFQFMHLSKGKRKHKIFSEKI